MQEYSLKPNINEFWPIVLIVAALATMTGAAMFFVVQNQTQSRLTTNRAPNISQLPAATGCAVSSQGSCYDGINQADAAKNNSFYYPFACNQLAGCNYSIALTPSGSGGTGTIPNQPPVPDHLNPSHVLIIINENSSGSEEVGLDYQQKRNVPVTNLCYVDTPTTETIGWDNFLNLKNQVLGCIDNNPNDIYYLVTTYGVPYLINMTGSGRLGDSFDNAISLDSALTLVAVPTAQLPNPAQWTTSELTQNNHNPYYSGISGNSFNKFLINQIVPPFSNNYFFNDYPIYLTTRLDGPSVAVAKGLVQKALQAETTGTTGNACLDLATGVPQLDILNAHVIRAYFALQSGGYPTTIDQTSAVIGKPGAEIQSCENLFLYTGTYNNQGYNNDTFDWLPGSVAVPLHSLNARTLKLTDPNNQGQWVAAAINDGATVAVASAVEPYAQNLVNTPIFYHFWLRGYNLASAAFAANPYLFFTHVVIGDPLYHIAPSAECHDSDGDYFGNCGYPVDCQDSDSSIHPDLAFEERYLLALTTDNDGDGVVDYDQDGDGALRCTSYPDCCDDCDDDNPNSYPNPETPAICPLSLEYETNVLNVNSFGGGWGYRWELPWYYIKADFTNSGTPKNYWRKSDDSSAIEYHLADVECEDLGEVWHIIPGYQEWPYVGDIYILYRPEVDEVVACRDREWSIYGPVGAVYRPLSPLPIGPWQ